MWDQRFSETGFAYGKEPNDLLREQAARLPPGPVLELAAGEGRNGVWLAERGHDVTLVDGSGVGLAKAEEMARERGVKVRAVVSDLAEYVIEPAAWSGIVSIWAHLPPALRARVHAACVRGLRPGGVFVLEAYTPAQLAHATGGPRQVDLLMTLEGLRAELAGLDFLVGRELEREIHEGKYHQGPSAVVQVVARRPG
jgi:SAM-dependent methyltransferase